jgi:hypothetical protein
MNFQGKPKKYLIIALKVIGWISLTLFGLVVLVALAIQIPFIQNKLTQKAISFLEDKIGTDVNLDHISLAIPKKIVLTGLYLEDQQKDTLLYAGELAVNTDLWQLTNQVIQLNDIELSDFKASVSRSERDSAFNFDYIIDAFTSDSIAAPDTTEAAPWQFSIGEVLLENIKIRFADRLMGNNISMHVGLLNLEMDEVDLEKSVFKADNFRLENIKADILQSKIPEDTVNVIPDSTEQQADIELGLNSIDWRNIEVLYNHQGTGQVA